MVVRDPVHLLTVEEMVVLEVVVDTTLEQEEVETHLPQLLLKETMEQIQLQVQVLHQVIQAVAVVEQLQLLYKHPLQMEQEITMAVQVQQLQLQQVL
tara:strand:- start:254 stop:544 length:291 start_codon:yes stop_codon:yes gene_type:complete